MQSKNTNDSVQLSTRYQQYDFAKRHLGGFGGRKVFPIGEINCEDIILPTITTRITADSNVSYVREKSTQKIKQIIGGSQGNRVYDPSGLAVTQTSQGTKTGLYAIPVLTPDRANKRQNGRRFKTDGEPSFTLTSQDKHGVMILPNRIRRLTPTECERLMGLPDGWTSEGIDEKGETIKISDSQRYKLTGNGVCVPVVKAIVERLII